MFLSISPCISYSFCFIKVVALSHPCEYVYFNLFIRIVALNIKKCLSLYACFWDLNSTLLYPRIATPCSLSGNICLVYFGHPFIFNLSESLCFRCVFCIAPWILYCDPNWSFFNMWLNAFTLIARADVFGLNYTIIFIIVCILFPVSFAMRCIFCSFI